MNTSIAAQSNCISESIIRSENTICASSYVNHTFKLANSANIPTAYPITIQPNDLFTFRLNTNQDNYMSINQLTITLVQSNSPLNLQIPYLLCTAKANNDNITNCYNVCNSSIIDIWPSNTNISINCTTPITVGYRWNIKISSCANSNTTNCYGSSSLSNDNFNIIPNLSISSKTISLNRTTISGLNSVHKDVPDQVLVFFQVVGFPSKWIQPNIIDPRLSITMGPFGNELPFNCTNVALVDTNTISCVTPKYIEPIAYCFSLATLSGLQNPAYQIISTGTDQIFGSPRPQVSSIEGCYTNPGTISYTLNGNVAVYPQYMPLAYNCDTIGGQSITIYGSNFIEANIVTFDGIPCYTNFISGSRLETTIPEGNGGNRNIKIYGGSIYSASSISLPIFAFNYAKATLLSVYTSTGCDISPDSLSLINCRRDGGISITITGHNFGSTGGIVLVNGNICNSLIHSDIFPHQSVSCILPGLTNNVLSASLSFIQASGDISVNSLTIQYSSCPINQQPNPNNVQLCENCMAGKDSTNGLYCEHCSVGKYSSIPGSSCINCPSYSIPNINATGCIYMENTTTIIVNNCSTNATVIPTCPICNITNTTTDSNVICPKLNNITCAEFADICNITSTNTLTIPNNTCNCSACEFNSTTNYIYINNTNTNNITCPPVSTCTNNTIIVNTTYAVCNSTGYPPFDAPICTNTTIIVNATCPITQCPTCSNNNTFIVNNTSVINSTCSTSNITNSNVNTNTAINNDSETSLGRSGESAVGVLAALLGCMILLNIYFGIRLCQTRSGKGETSTKQVTTTI